MRVVEEVSGFPAENGTIALVCRENKQNYNFIISTFLFKTAYN